MAPSSSQRRKRRRLSTVAPPPTGPRRRLTSGVSRPALEALARAEAAVFDYEYRAGNADAALVMLDVTTALQHEPTRERAIEVGRDVLWFGARRADTDFEALRSAIRLALGTLGSVPNRWRRWIEAVDLQTTDGARALVQASFAAVGARQAGMVGLADFLAAAGRLWSLQLAESIADSFQLRVDIAGLGIHGGVIEFFGDDPECQSLYVFDSLVDYEHWVIEEVEHAARFREVTWAESPARLTKPLLQAMCELSRRPLDPAWCPEVKRCPPDFTFATAHDVRILHSVLQALHHFLPAERQALVQWPGEPRSHAFSTDDPDGPITVMLTARATGFPHAGMPR